MLSAAGNLRGMSRSQAFVLKCDSSCRHFMCILGVCLYVMLKAIRLLST